MGVITWGWIALLTLIAVFFYSCSFAADAPEWAVRIMQETHKRVIFAPQNWYAKSYRFVSAGEEVWGNCSDFSMTALIQLLSEGHQAEIIQCGPAHVVAVSGPWMFDSREDGPVPVACNNN